MFIMIIFLKEEHEICGMKLAKTENILTLTLEPLSSLREFLISTFKLSEPGKPTLRNDFFFFFFF